MSPPRKIATIHDALFLKTMEAQVAAAAWLEARLPRDLASRIDWSTLSFRNETFVDEEMRYGSVDALFVSTMARNGCRCMCSWSTRRTCSG